MAWTNIANANLAVGAPVRSVDLLALRDNVSAVPNGDTGAPRIKAEALNGGQSGSAPIYAARAWVNFDGTTSPGTIRASGNVSSVSRDATGRYTVNFSTAMPDANYAAHAAGKRSGSSVGISNIRGAGTYSTTQVQIEMFDQNGTLQNDFNVISLSVFR
jgi:hypothetical protein